MKKNSDKYRIIITEKGPHQNQHTVDFDSFAAAKKAYKNAEKFWMGTAFNGVQVEGEEKIVTVSADVVASVSLVRVSACRSSMSKR